MAGVRVPAASPALSTAPTASVSLPSTPWGFRNHARPVPFASETDLRTATNISFKLIEEIRKARKDSAIVVLNFRALQARRIDEMQEALLKLSRLKLRWLWEVRVNHVSAKEERKALDREIDALLHQYGMHLLFACREDFVQLTRL
jgi:hypothetical protein